MRNPKRTMCAAVLALEAVVLGLTVPVLVVIEGVPVGLSLALGLGLLVLAVVAAGMLRRPAGYYLGTLVQVGALAMAFVIAQMAVVGVVFGALWATAWWLGVKIDRERAAYGATS